MKWLQQALGRGEDVGAGRAFIAEFRDFYNRWHLVIQDKQLAAAMEIVRREIDTGLGRKLEKIYFAHLHEIVEKRKDCWIGEQLLKGTLHFINLMKHSPPEMLPELQNVYREHMKKEFVPETCYRDAETDCALNEKDFRKALAGLAADWPERVDAALRERLEKLDADGANAWQTELVAQQAALG